MVSYKSILKKTMGKKVGLFIDDANLFYPQKILGWKVSWRKLKNFLSDHYKLVVCNYYLGMPLIEEARKRNKNLIGKIENSGYKVVTKPLKKIWLDSKKTNFIYKCNFDVEITLDVARSINKVDHIIIGSGDSDFVAIKDFALECDKTFMALCFEKLVAWEIRRVHHIFFEDIRKFVEKKR